MAQEFPNAAFGFHLPYHIRSFLGGLSDYEDKGPAGSFKFGQGLDIRKTKDTLSCQQALTDDLAAGTFDAQCYAVIPADDGNTYFFLYNGKIYRRNSSGTYLLVYTETNEGGRISGAGQWYDNNGNTYLVYATDTRFNIKRIIGTGYTNTEPWTDVNSVPASAGTWPKTNLTNNAWHTMRICEGALLIANDKYVALLGYDMSFTNNALLLRPGSVTKTLVERGVYTIIGCNNNNSKDESNLYAWDTTSLDCNDVTPIPLANINSMIDTEAALMQVGSNGQFYLSDMKNRMPLNQLNGGGTTNPNGVTSFKGLALFGVFNNSLGYNGIYSYGRLIKNAPFVLNFEYALPCDEIGAVQTVGTNVFITYKYGTNYGVKKIDTANKANATYQSLDLITPLGTRRYPIPLGRLLNWLNISIITAPLPAGCKVECWYRIDKVTTGGDGSGWLQANRDPDSANTLQFDDAGMQETTFYMGQKATVLEVMFKLIPFGNTTPEIYEYNAYFTAG